MKIFLGSLDVRFEMFVAYFCHHCVFWCVAVSMRVCEYACMRVYECVSEVQVRGWISLCVSMSVCG